MLKVRIYGTNKRKENKPFNYSYECVESINKEDYGNGTYIIMSKENGELCHVIDCRYMVGYNPKKAVTQFLENYYGENLDRIIIEDIKEL